MEDKLNIQYTTYDVADLRRLVELAEKCVGGPMVACSDGRGLHGSAWVCEYTHRASDYQHDIIASCEDVLWQGKGKKVWWIFGHGYAVTNETLIDNGKFASKLAAMLAAFEQWASELKPAIERCPYCGSKCIVGMGGPRGCGTRVACQNAFDGCVYLGPYRKSEAEAIAAHAAIAPAIKAALAGMKA